jgi:hypothetical protein
MSDAATATPDAPAAGKKPRKKPQRIPLNYALVALQKDESGNVVGFQTVPTPKMDKDNPRRDDYKRAVKAALEAGDQTAVEHYNGKQLTVIAFPEAFCYNAKVQEEVVRKVVITES